MKRLVLAVSIFSVSLAAAGFALAHNPPFGSAGDCDTWSRTLHGTPAPSGSPSHHRTEHAGAVNYDNLNDVGGPNQPLPNNSSIHTSSGHYMAQTGATRATYIEVVGGGQYEGEPYYQKMGEGGYVQGRIDGNGTPAGNNHVDFHANTFGPLSETNPNLTWKTHAEACVSVNNTKVQPAPQGTATPGVTVDCPFPSGSPSQISCK